jgi:hypothetical protein
MRFLPSSTREREYIEDGGKVGPCDAGLQGWDTQNSEVPRRWKTKSFDAFLIWTDYYEEWSDVPSTATPPLLKQHPSTETAATEEEKIKKRDKVDRDKRKGNALPCSSSIKCNVLTTNCYWWSDLATLCDDIKYTSQWEIVNNEDGSQILSPHGC